uniref:CAP-Gly domain-containing protein n=1 Tax=Macrostomum lignano TaxID=282301 RepID=A0A1I8FDI7_9PLAT
NASRELAIRCATPWTQSSGSSGSPAAAEQQEARPITDAKQNEGGGHGGSQLDGRVSIKILLGAGYFVDQKLSNGNIRQAAAASSANSASAPAANGHLWPACDGARPVQQQPFATAGRLPFAPKQRRHPVWRRSVKFTRYGGSDLEGPRCTLSGHLPGRTELLVALSWDQEEGKQRRGVRNGRRYFQCKPRKGVFVAFNKLIMCYQAA